MFLYSTIQTEIEEGSWIKASESIKNRQPNPMANCLPANWMVRAYCWRHNILWLQDKNQAGTELDTQLYRAERCYAHCWESHQSHLIVDPAFYNTARQDVSICIIVAWLRGIIDYFLNWIWGSFHQRKFKFVRNNFVKIPVGREVEYALGEKTYYYCYPNQS